MADPRKKQDEVQPIVMPQEMIPPPVTGKPQVKYTPPAQSTPAQPAQPAVDPATGAIIKTAQVYNTATALATKPVNQSAVREAKRQRGLATNARGEQKDNLDTTADIAEDMGEEEAQALEAQNAASQETTKRLDDFEAERQKQDAEFQDKINSLYAETEKLSKEVENTALNRNRLLDNPKKEDRMRANIGKVLDGISAALLGGAGRAPVGGYMDAVEKKLDADLEEQRANLENKKAGLSRRQGLLAEMYRIHGDFNSAKDRTKMVMLEQEARKFDEIARTAKSQNVRMAAEQSALEIRSKRAEIEAREADAAAKRAQAQAGGGVDKRLQGLLVSQGLQAQKDTQVDDANKVGGVVWTQKNPPKESVAKVKEFVATHNVVRGDLENLIREANEISTWDRAKGTVGLSEKIKRVEALKKQLQVSIAKGMGGTITQGDLDAAMKQMGNPSSWKPNSDAPLRALIDRHNAKGDNWLKPYNATLESSMPKPTLKTK